jgi:hypothetical protein
MAKVYIDKLATGDHGETLVMDQLRQRGWAVENLNQRKRNHPVFDIHAKKGVRELWINAKMNSLGPNNLSRKNARINSVNKKQITPPGPNDSNYMVIVRMMAPATPHFYVVPYHVAVQECADRQASHARRGIKCGLDGGFSFSIYWDFNPRKPSEPGRDIARRWARYLDNWKSLEGPIADIAHSS